MSKMLKAEIKGLVGRLDNIILEQPGKTVFNRFDTVRRLSKRTRHFGSETNLQTNKPLLNRLETKEEYQLAHAFSLFFLLVNYCEEPARERHLQSKNITATSLAALFREVKQAWVTEDQMRALSFGAKRMTPSAPNNCAVYWRPPSRALPPA